MKATFEFEIHEIFSVIRTLGEAFGKALAAEARRKVKR